jgi:predicted AAA+ superfamily ATPase
MYWRDSGLLHALLHVPDARSLLSQPWVGASWEGHCIEQILGTLSTRGIPCDPYYFRTFDGHEIDLVLETQSELWAIEFKLTSSPSPSDMERLEKTAALIGATRLALVSKTSAVIEGKDRISCDLPVFLLRMQG